jgi:hypothetical protein
LQRRIDSAIMEEQEARLHCDFMLDGTQSPEDVKNEVMQIIKSKLKK